MNIIKKIKKNKNSKINCLICDCDLITIPYIKKSLNNNQRNYTYNCSNCSFVTTYNELIAKEVIIAMSSYLVTNVFIKLHKDIDCNYKLYITLLTNNNLSITFKLNNNEDIYKQINNNLEKVIKLYNIT